MKVNKIQIKINDILNNSSLSIRDIVLIGLYNKYYTELVKEKCPKQLRKTAILNLLSTKICNEDINNLSQMLDDISYYNSKHTRNITDWTEKEIEFLCCTLNTYPTNITKALEYVAKVLNRNKKTVILKYYNNIRPDISHLNVNSFLALSTKVLNVSNKNSQISE